MIIVLRIQTTRSYSFKKNKKNNNNNNNNNRHLATLSLETRCKDVSAQNDMIEELKSCKTN